MNLPMNCTEAGGLLRDGSLTCEALARAYLTRINRLKTKLGAFITVTEEQALSTAEARDAELRNGFDRGPLHGIPIVHKDLYDTAGVLTTGGSEPFRSRVPAEDATVVKKLKAAGAVVLAKTNMNEFGAGSSGTNKAFGDVHNPWDLARSAGGSSSGTAAAIAAECCLAGTGSDTGGSIRIPASWCGVVGLRPTYGLVSLSGVLPRAYSLDCGGPLARTVPDVALMLNAMAGVDPSYKASVGRPYRFDYVAPLRGGIQGVRIGIIENYSFREVDRDVGDAVRIAIHKLAELGAQVRNVKIPLLSNTLDRSVLFSIILYEFNQIMHHQFGARMNKDLFGPVVRANLAKGETISRDVYETLISRRPTQVKELRQVFSEVDVLITPTMPMVAPALEADASTYERGFQFNLPFSFMGLPSLSVPCGLSSEGMPIGMLITGDVLQDGLVLKTAAAYEAETQFCKLRPSVSAGDS